jgi:hypothetical protein
MMKTKFRKDVSKYEFSEISANFTETYSIYMAVSRKYTQVS